MEDGDCRAGECCHPYKFCTRDTPCLKQVPGKFYLALYQLQWFIYKKKLFRIFPKNSICYFHFKGKGCQKEGQQCRFTYCTMVGCSTKTKCCEKGLKCLDTRFGIARCKKEGTNFRNTNKTYYYIYRVLYNHNFYLILF